MPECGQSMDSQPISCRGCGYPLHGLSGNKCPECGRAFDPADPRTFVAAGEMGLRCALGGRRGVVSGIAIVSGLIAMCLTAAGLHYENGFGRIPAVGVVWIDNGRLCIQRVTGPGRSTGEYARVLARSRSLASLSETTWNIAGIMYFRTTYSPTLGMLEVGVPLLYLVALFALIPGAWICHILRVRARSRNEPASSAADQIASDRPDGAVRAQRVVLIAGACWLSWMGMMATHELGHVLAVWAGGGNVDHVILHPFALSQTVIRRNPYPLAAVWAGPAAGCLLPLVLAGVVAAWRPRLNYLMFFFAGFCLIANGAYIGIGAFEGVGDAGQMLRHGTPFWVLPVFGLLTAVPGLLLWHAVSPRFGFGREPQPINPIHAWTVGALAVAALVAGLVFGTPGRV